MHSKDLECVRNESIRKTHRCKLLLVSIIMNRIHTRYSTLSNVFHSLIYNLIDLIRISCRMLDNLSQQLSIQNKRSGNNKSE
jgi:hypothetical protein